MGARCAWADGSEAMRHYHDTEWGVPSHDDRHLFEMLVLEGAQAGLSWSTILNRRTGYLTAFEGLDPEIMASYGEEDFTRLLADPRIIRNRLKVRAATTNARAFLTVATTHGTFARYLWEWVDGRPRDDRPVSAADVPTSDALSDAVSADLKRRGFTFVGTTIVYSYLQAVGVINDHLVTCPAR